MKKLCSTLLVLFITGCIRPLDAVTVDVDPRGWSTPVGVVFENADSLSTRELCIVVRPIAGRAPATLSLLVETLTPDSLATCEALEIPLREPTAPYRTGVVLSRKGPYTFRFTPSGNTLGISAIGITFR